MTIAVTDLVADLRRDHRNVRLLLDVLELEAGRLFDGRVPDLEVLHDTMYYMTVYPDAVHHPKEDRLYAELRAARPDLTCGFERISAEHRHIGEAGRALRNRFAALICDSLEPRKALVADTLRYVNTLRSHMQWEELDLFRRALVMARDGHRYLTFEDFDLDDPLFGARVTAPFAALHERIRGAVGHRTKHTADTCRDGAADRGRDRRTALRHE